MGELIKGLRAGRYELLQRLAIGGMGEVYIARQTGQGAFEKRLAIKLLLPHLSEEPAFVRMFLDEARIAARMNHPNIVQIFDLGQSDDGRYYIAMSLIEGVSLSRLLKASRARKEPLPLPVVRHIAAGLCDALSYAHSLCSPSGEPFHIVHRDVSPTNVLVSGSGAVLLTDFGIAKAQDNLHRTGTGQVRGKFAYMAPEQMRADARVDARADVFAASVTLFQAYTGLSPFVRGSDPETIDAVRSGRLPDPRRERPELSDRVVDALLRGAAVDVSSRLGSTRELKEALLDGPLAQPEELGALVSAWCSGELEPFQDGAPGEARGQTASMVAPTATGLRRGSPLLVAVLLGAFAGAAALAGLVLLGGREEPQAVRPPPPPAAPIPAPAPALEDDQPPALVGPPEAPPEPIEAPVVKSPRKRAAAAPAPKMGYLSADAAPWAVLSVDGREVDRTPISRYPLAAGEHALVFRNPRLGKEIHKKVRVVGAAEVSVRVTFE